MRFSNNSLTQIFFLFVFGGIVGLSLKTNIYLRLKEPLRYSNNSLERSFFYFFCLLILKVSLLSFNLYFIISDSTSKLIQIPYLVLPLFSHASNRLEPISVYKRVRGKDPSQAIEPLSWGPYIQSKDLESHKLLVKHTLKL